MNKIYVLVSFLILGISLSLEGQNSAFNYSTSHVNGRFYVGGLIGEADSLSIIRNNYARGSVTGLNFIGGLVGANQGVIGNSYSTGQVNGTGSQVGGLIGFNNGLVQQSYWDTMSSGIPVSSGGSGRITQEMSVPYASNTFVDWDFEKVWSDDSSPFQNDGYPIIQSLDAHKLKTRVFPLGSGSVSEGGYFKAFQEITLHAVPAVGFTFKGWMQDNIIIQSNSVFNFTIMESTTLTALFEPMPTSINEEGLEQLDISIYPNPARDHLWIKFNNSVPLKQLHVISLDGKILKTVNLQGQMLSDGIQLDISQLTRGLFILFFQSDKRQYTGKFVKL